MKGNRLLTNEKFIDPEFPMNENELVRFSANNDRVVLRRLSDLLRIAPRNPHPQFFPSRNTAPSKKISSDPFLPPFAT